MKSSMLGFAFFSAVAGALAGPPSATSLITLETDVIRMAFDETRNGAIVSLLDKASGHEFIEPAAALAMLYELQFEQAAATGTVTKTLGETDAVGTTIQRENGEVVIRVPRHVHAPEVSVECRFHVDSTTALLLGRITVTNQSKATLAAVRFPRLVGPKQLAPAAERDWLVLPYTDGCLVQAPGVTGNLPACPYPGVGSMQFLARYDDVAGLYLAAHDARGFTKTLNAGRRANRLCLEIAHHPPRQSSAIWMPSYELALGTFRGDWQAAADLYKHWAWQQPWCRQTLAQRVARGDVPQWLIAPSLFYAYSLRGELAGKTQGSRLPQVVAQAESWREVLAVPTTFMLMSWEKQGPWVTPDYFPPFGGERAFRAATTALHEKGHHTLVFLSGLKWTLRKQGGCDAGTLDDTAAFEQRGAPFAICDPEGRPLKAGEPDHGVGEYAELCPATPLAYELLRGAALECQRLGIDCVQADQIVGGGTRPCFGAHHGHPPGGGNWAATALYTLFDDIRRAGKKQNPDFAFSIEEPGEFFIPVLDTYHARDYAQGHWPRFGTGVIGVPLFTHVYHEFMHGYGGDSCAVSTNANSTALYQQAMNLVCGKTPAVSVWTQVYQPAATETAQARLLRGHVELWRGPAREFLVFGRRVATPPLSDVPMLHHKFWTAANRPSRELDLPAILQGCWRLPDGRVGSVFVCVANKPVSFESGQGVLTLQPGEAKFVQHPTAGK